VHIIVDGYNMIRQSDKLRRAEKQSLEVGRLALIRLVVLYRKKKGHRLTVVFDGWESGSPSEERDIVSGVHIIYSKLGEKADDVIKRIVRLKKEEMVVVTADRDIISFVERHKSAAVSPREFEEKIGDVQGKIDYFIHPDDDEDGLFADRLNKKGPAKRLSRKKKNEIARLRKL
jgi:predicted RNA-binding protein with PIN domain